MIDFDHVKYPFLFEPEGFEQLTNEEMTLVCERAVKRLRETLQKGEPTQLWADTVEYFSFFVASYIVSLINDDWVKKRFALFESRRSTAFLKKEKDMRLTDIAQTHFGWEINTIMGSKKTLFEVDFRSYLKNSVSIREPKWKLINRDLRKGFVRISKDEIVRLLEESIQRRILERTKIGLVEVPDFLKERIETLRNLVKRQRGTEIGVSKTFVFEALPPCIRDFYQSARTGKHLSHTARFTLVTFLVNVGFSVDEIVELFKSFSDFDERKTRYHLGTIIGTDKEKTRYFPPKCDTIKRYGFCVPDGFCKSVRHPMSYYRKALFRLRRIDSSTSMERVLL